MPSIRHFNVIAFALALATLCLVGLAAPTPGEACTMSSSGRCLGSDCKHDWQKCTKVDQFTCDCLPKKKPKDGAEPADLGPPCGDVIELEPAEAAGLIATEEGERAGGIISVRIYFEVQGLGSFRANSFDTANGTTDAWVKPGIPLSLTARPASGHRFAHWLINGNFSSTSATHRVSSKRGLTIQAVFEDATRASDGDARFSTTEGAEAAAGPVTGRLKVNACKGPVLKREVDLDLDGPPGHWVIGEFDCANACVLRDAANLFIAGKTMPAFPMDYRTPGARWLTSATKKGVDIRVEVGGKPFDHYLVSSKSDLRAVAQRLGSNACCSCGP
ncbi:MAG: hypothetical protein AAGN46_16790 [Acidobacteriota bacterium]